MINNNKSEAENEINDEEPGKLFIGGLSWETTEEKLQQYFSEFGEIIDSVVMKNVESGQSRGFGFVTFADPDCVQKVFTGRNHVLDGRAIDPKPCSSKTALKMKKNMQFPKIFLGGLPSNVTETDLRSIFSRYGEVMDVIIMYDHEKNKCRGFGFLSFEKDEEINKCVAEHFVHVNGKKVEVKRAEPRDGKTSAVNQWSSLQNERGSDGSQNQSFNNYPGWTAASNSGYGCGPPANNPVPYGSWSNPSPQWGQNYGNSAYNPYGAPQAAYGNWNWNMQQPAASMVPPPATASAVNHQSVNGSSPIVPPGQYHQPSNLAPAVHQVPGQPSVKPEYTNYSGYAGYPPSQNTTYSAGNIRAYAVDPNNPAVSADAYGTGPGPQRNNPSQQSYHPYRRV